MCADARFGEAPLAQTLAAAAAIRRLSSLLLAQEHPHPTVDVMLAKFAEWEPELVATAPADNAPRINEVPGDTRRVYLNHATDIGAITSTPTTPAAVWSSRWYTRDHRDWCTAASSPSSSIA